jgi:hypothetical protein
MAWSGLGAVPRRRLGKQDILPAVRPPRGKSLCSYEVQWPLEGNQPHPLPRRLCGSWISDRQTLEAFLEPGNRRPKSSVVCLAGQKGEPSPAFRRYSQPGICQSVGLQPGLVRSRVARAQAFARVVLTRRSGRCSPGPWRRVLVTAVSQARPGGRRPRVAPKGFRVPAVRVLSPPRRPGLGELTVQERHVPSRQAVSLSGFPSGDNSTVRHGLDLCQAIRGKKTADLRLPLRRSADHDNRPGERLKACRTTQTLAPW